MALGIRQGSHCDLLHYILGNFILFWTLLYCSFISCSTIAAPLTDQFQGKNPTFFHGRAWFEAIEPGFEMHTLKDHDSEPTVWVDVPEVLRDDGPFWKWGGPNLDDIGIITQSSSSKSSLMGRSWKSFQFSPGLSPSYSRM